MKRRRLPIGTQSFRVLRGDRCYYVDKTPFIGKLLEEGRHYFLSRPRRFGKSLFLDTLRELFEGSEKLFRGLHIHDHWDWSVQRPALRLSFNLGPYDEPGCTHTNLTWQLDRLQREFGVESPYETAPERFAHLIELLHRRSGRRVVVLVDEYDKPILDALEVPEVARANRSLLRGLYGVIKECDEHIRFTFLTGVSKFSKVSLFSGLNNLEDITLDPAYSAICGYTEADLDEVFAPELPGLDRERIRRWYNGYSWRGSEPVYNPFDILLLFKKREFRPYWIETGASKFLIDLLLRRRVSTMNLERMRADEELLSKFDVGDIGTEALLFQTGYLTITGERELGGAPEYRLGYPNREVKQSLNKWLLELMVPDAAQRRENLRLLQRAMGAGRPAGLKAALRQIFSAIPHQWHAGSEAGRYEAYYATAVSTHYAALGFHVTLEDSSSTGRADMVVEHGSGVYVFEFKVGAAEGTALRQIKERRYADKYLGREGPVYLLGVECSRETRNVEHVEVERAQ